MTKISFRSYDFKRKNVSFLECDYHNTYFNVVLYKANIILNLRCFGCESNDYVKEKTKNNLVLELLKKLKQYASILRLFYSFTFLISKRKFAIKAK